MPFFSNMLRRGLFSCSFCRGQALFPLEFSDAHFHMLFGFSPASGQESVTLVCPHCRLWLPAHSTSICLNAVDVKCPICGTINKSLDLEETDGWMECESCGEVTQQIKYVKTRKDYQFAGSFAPGISAVIELESTSWLEKQPDTEQEAWVRKARIWKVGILIVLLTLLYIAQWLIIRLVPRKNMLRLEGVDKA